MFLHKSFYPLIKFGINFSYKVYIFIGLGVILAYSFKISYYICFLLFYFIPDYLLILLNIIFKNEKI